MPDLSPQIKWARLKWGDMSNAILPRGHFKTSFADFAKVAFFDLYPPVVNQDYEDAKDLIREVVSAQDQETQSP